MPRKRQQCLFGIPWISSPSTESHSPPPKQKSKSNATNSPIHRPPFRPPGIASTPPQPPPHGIPRTEPPKPSNSLPSQSPTSSVIIDSPISSPLQSPSTPSHADRNINLPQQNPPAEKNTNPPPHIELELKSANENPNTPLETQSKSHHSKSKANNRNQLQPIPRPKAELHTTTASASGVKTKDALYEKQKETKIMFATSTPSSGKDITVVNPASTSANPVARNESTIPLSNEENENPTMQNGVKDEFSIMKQKLPIDDKTISVVTLAGDNRGVAMTVAGSHSHSNSTKTNRERKSTSTETDEGGKTYVNSNIQSVNNSIMSHGSITGRDPGVRVILPQQPQHDDNKQTCLESGKAAEGSINRAERLPYRPQAVVRRRCLRGLFLEPSDSDPDNPHKPRRHGCKFSCGEIAKDKDAVTK